MEVVIVDREFFLENGWKEHKGPRLALLDGDALFGLDEEYLAKGRLLAHWNIVGYPVSTGGKHFLTLEDIVRMEKEIENKEEIIAAQRLLIDSLMESNNLLKEKLNEMGKTND